MKKWFILLFCAWALCSCTSKEYDLCVYGGSSSGVITAYSAAQMGMDVLLVEPGQNLGGLTTGGLGFTDIGNKQVVKGLALDFYRKVGKHYGTLEQWIFEPSVAQNIMDDYAKHDNITVLKDHRLHSVKKKNNRIAEITLEQSSSPNKTKSIKASYFVDCSYEGDLMAQSGVSFTVGREANSQYNETYNGVQLLTRHQFPDGIDPYKVKGDPKSGLLWGISAQELAENGSGDSMVQAYNYRICLTDVKENMIPITRPENYDSTRYELLLRLMEIQPEKLSLNDYFIWSRMPNGKTDINNRGGFSSDMIGMNHSYPESSYSEREQIIKNHIDYTKGLLYFIGHDSRVPSLLRERMLLWGYPKDEYVNNNHWTHQLYVRESRRMIGEYVATQADCEGRAVPYDGIAMAAYQMDSHNCQRIVINKDGKAMVKNEGNVEVGGGLPYPISYRSITPKREQCTNLIVPVCLSASHIAYGSIRMEPVFMVLGQVAAVAIKQAIDNANCDVQDVDSRSINVLMDEDPYLDGTQPDILIDDSSADFNFSGDWQKYNKRGGFGLSFYQCDNYGYGKAVFSCSIPSAGEYEVYIYQPKADIYTENIKMQISVDSKVKDIIFNRSNIEIKGQTTTTWVKVDKLHLEKDDKFDLAIIADGSKGFARADAVLLIKK